MYFQYKRRAALHGRRRQTGARTNTSPPLLRWHVFAGSAFAAAALIGFLPSPASANGLFENRPWQFQTSADRANRAIVLDLMERKKGGFFDSFGPAQHTFFNMDCFITADSTGNASTSDMVASTSSPDIAPGSDMTADSTANEALNAGGSGPLNSSQSNTGQQSSNVSDNTATVGDVDASGGTTEQVLNNDQINLGDQHASVNDSTACSIQHGGN